MVDRSLSVLYNTYRKVIVAPNIEECMPRVLGNVRHQLDDKNRMRVPAKFREGLGSSLVMLPGRTGCLYIVPETNIDTMYDKYESDMYFDDAGSDFTTTIFGNAIDLVEDSQGRVTLDKNVKEKYGIKKEIVFVGKVKYLEVWPAESWDARYGVLDPDKLSKMLENLKKRGV